MLQVSHFVFGPVYKAVLGLFTALRLQILWAPRNHRGPKVSASFLPRCCRLADWKRSHTLLIHQEHMLRLRLVMHLFWLQAEAWWERWGRGDGGGCDREEVDGWQDRGTQETDQRNAGEPQVHTVSITFSSMNQTVAVPSCWPTCCWFCRRLKREAELIQAGHLDYKLEELWEEILRWVAQPNSVSDLFYFQICDMRLC